MSKHSVPNSVIHRKPLEQSCSIKIFVKTELLYKFTFQ